MSHTIAVDPHRNMAILVMDEPLFGLGPAVVADDPEEAQELLQTFVANLGAEPDKMPTIELMNEWQSFLIAFHGVLQVPAEIAAERPQEAAGAPAAPEPEGTPAPEQADPSSELPAGEPGSSATPPEPGASAGDASQTGEDSTHSPSDTGGEGQVCFACGGAGKHVIEGQDYTCQTCGGTGQLPGAGS